MMSDLIMPQSPTRRRSQLTLGHLIAAVFVIVTAFFTTQAQEPASSPAPASTPTAIEKEIERLKQEKEKAELKKAIRDAQPQPSSSPLEGKTTTDENVVIETQMVTYKAMSDVAERIGAEIRTGFEDATSIAIYDAEELHNLNHYRAAAPIVNGRIEAILDQYRNVFKEIEKFPELAATKGTVDEMWEDVGSTKDASKQGVKSGANADKRMSRLALIGDITGAGSALKAFADLLALMRTDTEIKGKSVSVEERALVAETFRSLRSKFDNKIKLYYPAVVQPEAEFGDFQSPFLMKLGGLYDQRADAQQRLLEKMFDVTAEFDKMTRKKAGAGEEVAALSKKIDELNLDRLQQELKKPWTLAQTRRFEKFIKGLEFRKSNALAERTAASTRLETLAKQKNLLEALQTLNQQSDDMVGALAKPDDKGKSELARLLRAENIDQVMGTTGYWLEFKAISAGGNNRTRKNLFRYFSGAKLDHSGGVIIEWALYDRNGASVQSNSDRSYPGYFAPKEIQSGKLQDAVSDQRKPQSPVVAKTRDQ